jgi:hypothetical protein
MEIKKNNSFQFSDYLFICHVTIRCFIFSIELRVLFLCKIRLKLYFEINLRKKQRVILLNYFRLDSFRFDFKEKIKNYRIFGIKCLI